MSNIDDISKNFENMQEIINNLSFSIPNLEPAIKVSKEFNTTNILSNASATLGSVNIPIINIENYYPFNVNDFDINPLKKSIERLENSRSLLLNRTLGIDSYKLMNDRIDTLSDLGKIIHKINKINLNQQTPYINQSINSIYAIKNNNISNALDNIKNIIGLPNNKINNYQADNIKKIESKYFSSLKNDDLNKDIEISDIKETKNNNSFFDGTKFEKVKINNNIRWKVDSDENFLYKYGLLFNRKTGEVYKPVKKISYSKISSNIWMYILITICHVAKNVKDAKDCYDAIMWILSNVIHLLTNL